VHKSPKKNSLKECVKNTLPQTAFSAILSTGLHGLVVNDRILAISMRDCASVLSLVIPKTWILVIHLLWWLVFSLRVR